MCVVVGNPIVQRGLDIEFHNRDYLAYLTAQQPVFDPERFWMLGPSPSKVVAEVLAASDVHVAPGRVYPVGHSVLEAMASGCVVVASDTSPHREVIAPGQSGLLFRPDDPVHLFKTVLAALDDRAAHRSLGDAASRAVNEKYAQDVCLPQLAERFSTLVASAGKMS